MQIVRIINPDVKQTKVERIARGPEWESGLSGQNQEETKKLPGIVEISGEVMERSKVSYGIALDIGTTTVEMALYRSDREEALRCLCERNAQTVMGADVMMRLMHCQNGKQKKLEELIRRQVEAMAERICLGFCRIDQIQKISVVGNTTMCHIFLGKDTSGLAGSPFTPAYQGAYSCMGRELGMSWLKEVIIYVLPGIGAHVGADAVAMAFALGLTAEEEEKGAADMEELSLAIDIGTNAELILRDRGSFLACSTAAGPAFEGASISQGMRGGPGAIAGFRIAVRTGNLILDVLGEKDELPQVKGICGSGLVDVVAALLQSGLLLPDGYLLERGQAEEQGIPAFLIERMQPDGFVLYQGKEADGEKDVVITREDIRQFQLAKAAVQAGIRLLLAAAGRTSDELEKVSITGAFGGNISKQNAIRMGLLPEIGADKLVITENAALEGAASALFSRSFQERMEQFAKTVRHLELAEEESFQREYLACMRLGGF